jgi:hypothetical protein
MDSEAKLALKELKEGVLARRRLFKRLRALSSAEIMKKLKKNQFETVLINFRGI